MITKTTIQMLTRKGFTELFWKKFNSGNFKKHEDAYEQLEIEYETEFGIRKYKNFKSFRRRRDEKSCMK